MDDVEEGREPVDLVELARQRRREVEAEPVDVALDHEVAERVHDQPQHRRMHRVERVAGARVVQVVARVAGHRPVVREVVDPLEARARSEVVALGRVVVDDVEDHLDPRAVQRLDHPLELLHLLAPPSGRRVQGVRSQVADRAVTPVVREPPRGQLVLVGDVVDRQQLDRGHAERGQVLERRLRGEPCVRAAQLFPHCRHLLGEALHMRLVDDRLVPGRGGVPVVFPVERLVDHDRLGDHGRVVLVVPLEVGVLSVRHVRQRVPALPQHGALDRLRVRVDQQLVRVEAMPLLRRPPPVDAVAVPLPRPDPRQVAVPVERGALGERVTRLTVGLVEEAELDLLRVLAEEREVRSLPVPPRPQWERLARPHSHESSSTVGWPAICTQRRYPSRRALSRSFGAPQPPERPGSEQGAEHEHQRERERDVHLVAREQAAHRLEHVGERVEPLRRSRSSR